MKPRSQFHGGRSLRRKAKKVLKRKKKSKPVRKILGMLKKIQKPILSKLGCFSLLLHQQEEPSPHRRLPDADRRGAERCAGFFDVIDPLKDLVSVEQLNAPQAAGKCPGAGSGVSGLCAGSGVFFALGGENMAGKGTETDFGFPT